MTDYSDSSKVRHRIEVTVHEIENIEREVAVARQLVKYFDQDIKNLIARFIND